MDESFEIAALDQLVAAVDLLASAGVLHRFIRPHNPRECDGMLTCSCPGPYWKMHPEWSEWMERRR